MKKYKRDFKNNPIYIITTKLNRNKSDHNYNGFITAI